uniref:ribonuclease H n=1 Tax=Leptobrachium leishanense TaxID=445787 RepID=A0A8C5PHN1_9ANUR
MDPADLSSQLTRIAARQKEQDHRMDQIALALQTLLNRSTTGTASPPEPVLPRASSASPEGCRLSMKAPVRYDGTPNLCRGFLTQLEILFENNPGSCVSDKAKVGYLINHLTDKALLWATPLWENKKPIIYDYEGFTSELKRTFDPSRRATNAGRSLFHIKQGNRRVSDYAIEFKTLTSEVHWPNDVLTLAFTEGLNEALMFELAPLKLPEHLDHLVDFCIAMDDQIRDRRHSRDRPRRVLPPLPLVPRHTSTSGTPEPERTDLPVVEPMQIGRTGISEAERTHRRERGLCFYCAGAGHFRLQCPQRPRGGRGDTGKPGQRTPTSQVIGSLYASFVDNEKKKTRILVPISLTWEGVHLETEAFLDSGASGNFMDRVFASKNLMPLVLKERPLMVEAIDGKPLSCPHITHDTIEVCMKTGVLHRETIRFQIIDSPSCPVVLGFPWLTEHNPVIDWVQRDIRCWGPSCQLKCMGRVTVIGSLNIATAPPLSTVVPDCYQALKEVFSKARTEVLPPHRPYDCAIELLPGTMPPRGHVYPLSQKENDIMEEYIKENLERGFIRRSSSPAGAGFFFVSKKEGDLRPCIDYRGLNRITIRNAYPIPLITELFDRLKGARIYTKLDLRGAYNLIRVKKGHEWKTAFNTRSGHYEYLVMPFGLCNAPAVFQDLINDTLRDFLQTFVIVYLDDILIYSPDKETHHAHVQQVLRRLLKAGLYCKLEKCLFDREMVHFLGYIITPEGFQMDPGKLSAILDWPLPQGLKAIQRFLGFTNYYRRFIKDFSTLVAPLTAMTKKRGGKSEVDTPGQASLRGPQTGIHDCPCSPTS